MKNNRNVTFVSRPCFDNMFHVIYAHEWMNNAQVHEMQVQLCKHNTRGVTQAPEHIKPPNSRNAVTILLLHIYIVALSLGVG